MKLFNLLLILFCVCLSLVLVGCKHETIKFYRESKFQQVMQNSSSTTPKSDKKVYRHSSGMVIYKDTSSQSDSSNMRFGPRDINFDLPIKIK